MRHCLCTLLFKSRILRNRILFVPYRHTYLHYSLIGYYRLTAMAVITISIKLVAKSVLTTRTVSLLLLAIIRHTLQPSYSPHHLRHLPIKLTPKHLSLLSHSRPIHCYSTHLITFIYISLNTFLNIEIASE